MSCNQQPYTWPAFVPGKIKLAKGVLYILAQVSGAVCGAFLLRSVIPNALEEGLGAHALSPAMASESA
ncbi:MAG: aquaporin [Chloroflexi bacterium]|nr:aquaporin [Chloroflexota bacterium]